MTVLFSGRPGGLATTPDGTVFVSDASSGAIWRVTADRGPEVVSGSPIEGATGMARVRLLGPKGLAVAPDGRLLIADAAGHRVCELSTTGTMRVVAGGAAGNRDGGGTEASFRFPSDVAVGRDGTCYVADTGNHRIRTITSDGVVGTLAGSIYDYGDGMGPSARFRLPEGVGIDARGACYVADTGNSAVRRIFPDGQVETIAGSPPDGCARGLGAAAGLCSPTRLALGRDGGVWVVDQGHRALLRIEPDRSVTSPLALAERHFPVAVAVSWRGEVVVAGVSLDQSSRPEACLFSEPETFPLAGRRGEGETRPAPVAA